MLPIADNPSAKNPTPLLTILPIAFLTVPFPPVSAHFATVFKNVAAVLPSSAIVFKVLAVVFAPVIVVLYACIAFNISIAAVAILSPLFKNITAGVKIGNISDKESNTFVKSCNGCTIVSIFLADLSNISVCCISSIDFL